MNLKSVFAFRICSNSTIHYLFYHVYSSLNKPLYWFPLFIFCFVHRKDSFKILSYRKLFPYKIFSSGIPSHMQQTISVSWRLGHLTKSTSWLTWKFKANLSSSLIQFSMLALLTFNHSWYFLVLQALYLLFTPLLDALSSNFWESPLNFMFRILFNISSIEETS